MSKEEVSGFFKDQRIWLTGASSGIGLALLENLLCLGAKVIATARHSETLKHLISDRCVFLPCDFSEKQDPETLGQKLADIWDGLDVVILNAGICEYLELENFKVSFFEKTFQVNYFGLLTGIEAALPLLLKSSSPYLLGMSSSVVFFHGYPRAEAYGASKAAIRYTLEALQGHCQAWHPKFSVSIIYPGFVKTPLTDRNDFPMPMRISAQEAAAAIIQAMPHRPPEISFPFWFIFWTKLLNAILPIRQKLSWFQKNFVKQGSKTEMSNKP